MWEKNTLNCMNFWRSFGSISTHTHNHRKIVWEKWKKVWAKIQLTSMIGSDVEWTGFVYAE